MRYSSANFDHVRALVQLGMGYSMIVAACAARDRLTRRARAFFEHCCRQSA
ncbi:hypothetical protein [Streptomyces sp. SAI-129]|uniref:hypothetical protein n=1 Tax=Streptomyces sp. SAI-129 TaxID=3377727 RepID=UPI003C7C9D88